MSKFNVYLIIGLLFSIKSDDPENFFDIVSAFFAVYYFGAALFSAYKGRK